MHALAASLRRVGLVALNESRRTGGSFDRRTSLALVALGLVTAIVMADVAERGFDFDHGIYRVAVGDDALLAEAVLRSPLFAPVLADAPRALVEAGQAELALEGDRVYAAGTDKGLAALDALQDAVRDLTVRRMAAEPDDAAAFPVRVEVVYEVQPRRASNAFPATAELPQAPEDGSTTPPEGTATGTEGGAAPPPSELAEREGGFDLIPQERSYATPQTLAPPFPFRSLILAYLFLVPMNFVVQVYAGSAIAERVGRKGEALLASPARPWEIVVGKALPYFLLMTGIGAVVAVGIGAGWMSMLAVAALALAFLGLEFVAAMFARSFRELTFLTVFASVLLTVFAFLPAVFSDVHPIAYISPITLVVADLRDEPVALAQMLYATLPLSLLSLAFFVLGTALYREEDLFHQKPVHAKLLDALARQVRGVGGGFRLSLLLLPAVLVVELLLVTFLFAWPVDVGVLGGLVAIAVVEETFKGLPSYAAVRRGAVPARRALVFGALTGLGFFVAEKGFLLVSLAGLMDVPAGAAVFGAAGAGLAPGASAALAALLVLSPLALHVVTAGMSAWGARQGRNGFLAGFTAAVAVHTAYNWTVVHLVGGRL